MMPTIDDALEYLGIDYEDSVVTANVRRSLEAAQSVLYGAVGEDVETYLPDDPRVTKLVLMYTDELYSGRGVAGSNAGSATGRLVADMELQLRLELRQAKEARGV